ncbi:hypothetical protein BC830DRAFT_1143721, partial [Chytriomyces sp. MP71]
MTFSFLATPPSHEANKPWQYCELTSDTNALYSPRPLSPTHHADKRPQYDAHPQGPSQAQRPRPG